MEQDREAIIQERDGWPGFRDLLLAWLLYATSREWRSAMRIHRSPQLRRVLQQFMTGATVSFSMQTIPIHIIYHIFIKIIFMAILCIYQIVRGFGLKLKEILLWTGLFFTCHGEMILFK